MRKEFDHLYIENSRISFKKRAAEVFSLSYNDISIEKLTSEDGDYFSFSLPRTLFMDQTLQDDATISLAKSIKDMLKKYKIKNDDLVLVIGVGNAGMTADALGARTLKYLDITEHFYKRDALAYKKGRLASIAAGVSGVTGIDSFDIVKGVVDRIKPSFIIAIDTLASKKAKRLQRVIQLSDKGITPGSGVNNSKKELSLDSLGVPLIAIGVPLVIYAKNIVAEFFDKNQKPPKSDYKKLGEEFESLVVTVKEIDITVDDFAKVIGNAINFAVHGKPN